MGRAGEPSQELVLEPHEFQLLDPAHRLVHDMEAVAVGNEARVADARQPTPHGAVDAGVNADQKDGRPNGDIGLNGEQERSDQQGDEGAGDQKHRGQDGFANDIIHLGQQILADVGAVARQEKDIGLAQIAGEQPAADRIGPHQAKADLDIAGGGAHRHAEKDHQKDDGPGGHDHLQIGLDPGHALKPDEQPVGLDVGGIRDDLEEGQDDGDAGNFKQRHDEGEAKQDQIAFLLALGQNLPDQSVGADHRGSLELEEVASGRGKLRA